MSRGLDTYLLLNTPAPMVVLIVFVAVGMMSNTWVLIIAGRQAKRPDIR